MDRRTLLKLLGGVAALPALGKAIKGAGIKSIKAAGKVLPKVSGMPEWFGPLVNKIMKEGVDVSPTVKRVEDMTVVKKLEIPSATGEPEIITLTKNKTTGEISIETNLGGPGDTPFELNYRPPKSDIDLKTGKEIKEPGEFSVVENRPRPDYTDPGNYEFDWEAVSKDQALSDLERVEKITTGKIKNLTEAEKRAAQRKGYYDSPYDDISNRYPEPDYADGGIASFAYGGLTKTVPPVSGPDPQGVETLFKKRYS